MNTNTTTTITDRIELARELMGQRIDSESIEEGNRELFNLLDGGDEFECLILPGDSAEAIRANIVTALELASQPVPAITTGRNREDKRQRAEWQRKRLHLLCRVSLALLEPTAESGDAADKLAAIKAILEGAAA
ncbi:MAG: hypothetical protein RLZZ22_1348 [Pseudomonadota bacterium]